MLRFSYSISHPGSQCEPCKATQARSERSHSAQTAGRWPPPAATEAFASGTLRINRHRGFFWAIPIVSTQLLSVPTENGSFQPARTEVLSYGTPHQVIKPQR